ncbi:Copia protein, partial [Mucuna pruriens]
MKKEKTFPTTTTEKLEFIHFVVCGPIQIETPGGSRLSQEVKYKFRLVAKGFLQKVGIYYGEVYTPIARFETIRLVVAIATNANWSIVKSAFLNGLLEEEIYYKTIMHQSKYTKDLLKRLNMQQSNPVGTPAEVGLTLKETNEERVWCFKRILRSPNFWFSTKELVVTLLSCEAKYIAASETVCQAVWLETLMEDLQVKNLGKIKLLVGNKFAIDLARHLIAHERSKHIETKFHFLREQVNNDKLRTKHCKTKIKFVDILTKTLKL